MIPQSQQKKKKNSSKVNMTISFIFHGLLILAAIYFAAREGYLGKKVHDITVYKVKEEKPPPPPPPKKIEQPKEETKPAAAPPKEEEAKAPPPPTTAPAVAPPPAQIADFNFDDGAKAVNTETNPVMIYKGYIEYVMRSRWDRPDNMDDSTYEADVAVNVGKDGSISQSQWLKGSGNKRWDQSVKDALSAVTQIDRRPPTNFPPNITIRFDTEDETEPALQ